MRIDAKEFSDLLEHFEIKVDVRCSQAWREKYNSMQRACEEEIAKLKQALDGAAMREQAAAQKAAFPQVQAEQKRIVKAIMAADRDEDFKRDMIRYLCLGDIK